MCSHDRKMQSGVEPPHSTGRGKQRPYDKKVDTEVRSYGNARDQAQPLHSVQGKQEWLRYSSAARAATCAAPSLRSGQALRSALGEQEWLRNFENYVPEAGASGLGV
jgi:hypothetical protein